ncbi:hypothetical protein HOA91_05765 [Candidatus Woesearchaeota archaeon]|jgi:hypothetical protein|nr:hypothetical protein [Candidatus Woesearchaeota archaeon]
MALIDNLIIRYHRLEDRVAIKDICADTGFLGKPIDPVFSDRELFADIMNGYYLKKEPEHTFVAEVDNQVVGYITGSVNRFAHLGLALNAIKPTTKAVSRLLTGKYEDSPQNKEFLNWLFTKAALEMPNHPKNAAHAHFNIIDGFRYEGIGTALIETAFKKLGPDLQSRGIKNLYGEVFAHQEKPEEYFINAGFNIYDKKESTLFRNHIEGPVHFLCITKEI